MKILKVYFTGFNTAPGFPARFSSLDAKQVESLMAFKGGFVAHNKGKTKFYPAAAVLCADVELDADEIRDLPLAKAKK